MSSTSIKIASTKKNTKFEGMIEKLAYLAGIANPIGTIPQAYEIWSQQDAAGVSLFTWLTYLGISVIMTFYGKIHQEKPLMLMYGALIMINFVVVMGILVY